jgi:hypothetical protein
MCTNLYSERRDKQILTLLKAVYMDYITVQSLKPNIYRIIQEKNLAENGDKLQTSSFAT